MSGRLSGRVALVTGSTSGIGRGIADMFAEQGARVMVTGRREQLGETVAREIRTAGGEAAYQRADLTEAAEVAALIEATVDRFGRLDILVNNAAAADLARVADGRVDRTDPELWDTSYQTDVRSAMLCSKYAMPHLIASGHGSIINMSSIHAVRATGWDAYAMAKGALVSLTRSMAVGCAPDRVRVNAICPGLVLVERNEAVWQDNPEAFQAVLGKMLTRPGRPRDIAYCAVYLASDEAEYVTGAIFNIDGGASALW